MFAETRHDGVCMGRKGETLWAVASGLGGVAVPSGIAVLGHFGLEPTPLAWILLAVVSAGLLLVCAGLVAHLFWSWLGDLKVPDGERTSLTIGAVIVAGLVVFGGWTWGVQSAPAPTTDRGAMTKEVRYYPLPSPSASVRTEQRPAATTYRIVVDDPPKQTRPEASARTPPAKVAEADPELEAMIRRIERKRVESRASLQCSTSRWRVDSGLIGLIAAAANAQNQFYSYRIGKQMVGDYAAWLKRTQEFLYANKDQLPDTSVFDLAKGERDGSIFAGEGGNAWRAMEAKRLALESLRRQLEAIPCDKIGKAAVAECEEAGNCASVGK